MLQELCCHSTDPPIVHCNDVQITYKASNPVRHARSKHIEVDIHFFSREGLIWKSNYMFVDNILGSKFTF